VQRAHTALQAVATNAKPSDIIQPGHIFPLVAKPGGVLRRAGHTEAGVDLARMAGFEPAALIVEIMNEDGTMARRPQLEEFAVKHDLRMGTIADLIEYRALHEHSVELRDSKTVTSRKTVTPWCGCRPSMPCATYWAPVLKEQNPAGPTAGLWSTSLQKATARWY